MVVACFPYVVQQGVADDEQDQKLWTDPLGKNIKIVS